MLFLVFELLTKKFENCAKYGVFKALYLTIETGHHYVILSQEQQSIQLFYDESTRDFDDSLFFRKDPLIFSEKIVKN